MSDRVTTPGGAGFAGLIGIEEAGPAGMVTLRADLGDGAVRAALAGAGVAVPEPGRATGTGKAGALWMSPDELMILCDRGAAAGMAGTLAVALAGHHHLAVDVSDARAVFRLTGEGRAIREVLAKLTPADLRASALPVGQVRRSRLAQVPAAFWFTGADAASLVVFRSVAAYALAALRNAAAPGSAVGHF